MTSQRPVPAQSMAKLTGFAYLTYSACGLYITFGPAKTVWRSLHVDVSALAGSGEFLLRSSLLAEMLMAVFTVVAGAAMYATLRPINAGVATVGGLLRVTEGAIAGGLLLFKYAAFAVMKRDDLVSAFSAEQRQGLYFLLKHVHGMGLYFYLLALGVGGTMLLALCYQARLVPRGLGAWGILTYALMFIVPGLVILFPSLKQWVMVVFLPGAAFEILFGFWLALRGVSTTARVV